MSEPIRVAVVSVNAGDVVPGRFGEAGLREIAVALGGAGEESDVWEALKAAFDLHEVQQLGELLLDAVLLDPPIPAYCETMLRRMMDPEDPPWVDYEISADRFNLWYCHYLVHRCYPDRWPAPSILTARLDVTVPSAEQRPPGRRSPPGDRTAFLARLLAARPGANPVREEAARQADGATEWCFDVVWSAEVGAWTKLSPEDAAAEGLPAGAVRFEAEAWLTPQWRGDLGEGQTWTV